MLHGVLSSTPAPSHCGYWALGSRLGGLRSGLPNFNLGSLVWLVRTGGQTLDVCFPCSRVSSSVARRSGSCPLSGPQGASEVVL